jgi:hypothetical protein
MKKLFILLAQKGYEVHNKRLLGNPEYTSEEAKKRDFLQEIGLIVEWLRVNHDIWVYSYPIHPFNSDEDTSYPKTVWISKIISTNYKFEEKFIDADNGLAINHHKSPQEAYSAAFDYVLNNLI